jgi:hypothetical protein
MREISDSEVNDRGDIMITRGGNISSASKTCSLLLIDWSLLNAKW